MEDDPLRKLRVVRYGDAAWYFQRDGYRGSVVGVDLLVCRREHGGADCVQGAGDAVGKAGTRRGVAILKRKEGAQLSALPLFFLMFRGCLLSVWLRTRGCPWFW